MGILEQRAPCDTASDSFCTILDHVSIVPGVHAQIPWTTFSFARSALVAALTVVSLTQFPIHSVQV